MGVGGGWWVGNVVGMRRSDLMLVPGFVTGFCYRFFFRPSSLIDSLRWISLEDDLSDGVYLVLPDWNGIVFGITQLTV